MSATSLDPLGPGTLFTLVGSTVISSFGLVLFHGQLLGRTYSQEGVLFVGKPHSALVFSVEPIDVPSTRETHVP